MTKFKAETDWIFASPVSMDHRPYSHTGRARTPAGLDRRSPWASFGTHTFRHTYRSLLDETGAPIGVQQKLMRHSNVATTMNVYGNSTLRAKQQANSKVVQMVMRHEQPKAELQEMAV